MCKHFIIYVDLFLESVNFDGVILLVYIGNNYLINIFLQFKAAFVKLEIIASDL